MDKRTLGMNGLEVSAIGLGCMSMTGGRGQVVIATKFGWDIDPVERKRGRVTSSPEVIKQVVDGSLQRLGVDTAFRYV
jgi:aryl-alcohol dehydrogenase-like predicted oxidoreductase